MRVIAGTARGRRLTAPRGSRTRPTSDRVREAVFSSLHPRIPDAAILDLFAGSGAMAIEALSRGAGSAVLVEDDRAALAAIDGNLDRTGVGARATVVAASLPGAMARLVGPFDVVFLDPPYDLDRGVLADVLARLSPLLAPDAVIRLEQSGRAGDPPWPDSLLPGRRRRYGDTAIHEATVAGGDRGR